MTSQYRKKPVVIDAIQLTAESFDAVEKFICVNAGDFRHYRHEGDFLSKKNPIGLNKKTLEGTMMASLGDYIIKGVNGEFYPCKPDIFEKTYERECAENG